MNEWNDIAVLTPPGDIDIASVPALRRRLDNLIDRGVRRVVINCQTVGFIDSTGLAFLLTRARELMRHEGLLSLVNASDEVVRFLEIARLVDILHVAGPARESIPAIPVGVAAMEQERRSKARHRESPVLSAPCGRAPRIASPEA